MTRALLAGIATLIISTGIGAQTAEAHSELESSSPTAGARLDAPPAQIRCIFTETMEDKFAAVTVSIDGSKAQPVASRVDGATVTATAPNAVPAEEQEWIVAYRVVSADGHPISGTITFAVAAPSSKPSPSSSSAADRSATPTPASPTAVPELPHGNRLWPLVVIGVLSLVAAPIGIALLGVRPHRAGPAEAEERPTQDVEVGPPDDAASGDDPAAPPQPETGHSDDR